MEKSQVLFPAAIPRVMQVVAALIIKMRRELGLGWEPVFTPYLYQAHRCWQWWFKAGLFFGKESL
jgi:hypothetical protein